MRLPLFTIVALTLAACAGESRAFDSECAQWQDLYRAASPAEIRLEREALQEVLEKDTDPYYESSFQSGRYEVVGQYTSGTEYPLPVDTTVLSAFRFLPNGDVGMVVLPEAEFPEQYRLKRQVEWLIAQEDH